jgi:RsmE family RNA methyltransferase
MKRLLPQLATLGVRRLFLVGAEKVEKAFWGAQLLKEEIYRPLLIDGLQQAGTTAVPTIETFKSFRHFVERKLNAHFVDQPTRFVAHPETIPLGEATLLSLPAGTGHRQKRQECRFPEDAKRQECRFPEVPVLAVGPEGGWTDEEVGMLEEKGFARMSLGPRILRTDTALIALISRLMESFDMNAAKMAALPVNIA